MGGHAMQTVHVSDAKFTARHIPIPLCTATKIHTNVYFFFATSSSNVRVLNPQKDNQT